MFYGQNRRRKVIAFSEGLREITEKVAADTSRMLLSDRVPAPIYEPRKCALCSLMDYCQPRAPHGPSDVSNWLRDAIED